MQHNLKCVTFAFYPGTEATLIHTFSFSIDLNSDIVDTLGRRLEKAENNVIVMNTMAQAICYNSCYLSYTSCFSQFFLFALGSNPLAMG